MERRILKVAFQCIISVVLARTEEVFNTTPPPVKTNFSCHGRNMGFYADVDANCKIYHTCDNYGNKFSYRCPEETAFRQDALICDHAHLVDCQATTYSSESLQTDKRGNTDFGLPSFLRISSVGSSNARRSFSRSFQVIQRPNKTSKVHPGFVFSASVFLRDRNDEGNTKKSIESSDEESSTLTRPILDGCHVNGERTESRISRPYSERSDSKADFTNRFSNFRNDRITKQEGSFAKETTESFRPTLPLNRNEQSTTEAASMGFSKIFHYNRDYPYVETLRSIQANSQPTTTARTPAATTEIPVHALTLSLKPLVPNELEYDPYYPKSFPSSTEAYYTPSHRGKQHGSARTSTQSSWSGVDFEIPDILPDLNTLEDLVDRRKLFYIPRVKPS